MRTTITRKLDIRQSGVTPAWRVGMAAWEWKEITGSSMSGVNPTVMPAGNTGPSSRIDAWCGLAADPVTNILYSAANGGHQDYSGNEVVTIDLSADAPTWQIILQPTAAASVVADAASYADGRPPSAHTYYSLHVVKARNRVFRFGNSESWQNALGPAGVNAFDILAGDWDGAGSSPNTAWASAQPAGHGGQAQDLTTEDVYWIHGSGASLRRFNAGTGTQSTLASISGVNSDVNDVRPMVYDHTRGRLLMIGDAYRPTIGGRVWTNNGGSGSWATFDFSGAFAATLAAPNHAGAHFNETLDRVVVKTGSGAQILTVNPTTYATAAQATTGGTPPNAVKGVYGRFLYLPLLGGYAYYPAYSGNVWFLATE